ncbi:MAG: hypothetical protein KAT40_02355 [Bacteroidales bacterium]|nr:hypothetical protein [Bacteroidales bacterium]
MIIGLFRTILIIIVFYFVVKLLVKFLFPPSSNNSSMNNRNNNPKKKEGDITIHFDKRTDKKMFGKDSGEYIDYEDVDKDE